MSEFGVVFSSRTGVSLLWSTLGEREERPWAGLGMGACWAWYLRAQIKHLLDLFIPQHWEEGQQLCWKPFWAICSALSQLGLPVVGLERCLLSAAAGGSVEGRQEHPELGKGTGCGS